MTINEEQETRNITRAGIQKNVGGFNLDDIVRDKLAEDERLKRELKEAERKRKIEEVRKRKEGAKRRTQDKKPNKKNNTDHHFTVEDLVERGNDNFYCDDDNVGQKYKGITAYSSVGIPKSLEKCLQWAGRNNGIVATMPYLIAGLSVARPDNYLLQRFHAAYSEELVGIDKKGKFSRGKPVIITFHGGGILTPKRIRKAYNDGLTPQCSAKLTETEFDGLLERKLPSGESVTLYTIEEVLGGAVKNPFGRYGVINTDFENAKASIDGHQDENYFLNNNLVIARAGSTQYIKPYFDTVKDSNENVGNWHGFRKIDPRVSQGRVLFVNGNDKGLIGFVLCDLARFVGLAPEAQSAKKSSEDYSRGDHL